MAGIPSLLENAFSRFAGLDTTVKRELARARGRPRAEAPPAPDAVLARLVEAEIIPRLMLVHTLGAAANEDGVGEEGAVAEVVRLSLRSDPSALLGYVGGLLDQGVGIDTVYIEHMIPAARRLGELWEEDRASFTEVTIGLSRLQQVVHAFGGRYPTGDGSESEARSALFVPVEGEQHTFGLCLVEDAFRRAGWRTTIEPAPRPGEAAEIVSGEWFDVFGLTASTEAQMSAAAACVRAVRRASRNKEILVIVGGRLFLEEPDRAGEVGADAAAANAGEALLLAGQTLRRRAPSS